MTIILSFLFYQVSYGQMAISDMVFLQGSLYGGLPIEITVHIGEEISGFSIYGSERKLEYQIEGEKTKDGFMLYELDEQEVLSGILEIKADLTTGIWNSTDYAQNIPISFDADPDMTTLDDVSHQSFVAVNFPKEGEKFEKLLGGRILSVMRDIAESYGAKEVISPKDSPRNRFENRAIAVNKVTLDSKDLLSGHITFFDNQSSDTHTIAYSYDRNKEEILSLNKIFKKNFDYGFFLKQYINQKKDSMVGLISPLELQWIKNSHFPHYVLTDDGLKFFNNHSSIFGRQSFLIPYHEISNSIGQKSIVNFIKKKK